MNFLWSIFFLLLSIGLILIYVALLASVPLMIYYITFVNCNWLKRTRHYIWSGVKFLVIAALSVGIFFGYLELFYFFLKSHPTINGHPHVYLTWAFQLNIALMLGLGFFYACLVINIYFLDREKKKKSIKETFFFRYCRSEAAKKIAVGIILLCLALYVVQRVEWMGKDNANLEAKEYWVAGQVLNGFRMGFSTAINPEIWVMSPLNWLQRQIYNRGLRYLPQGDGERAVWENTWFWHHYTRMGRGPLLPTLKKGVLFEDHIWQCLKTMATKPYADHQMEVEHYYRDFPALAITYQFNKKFEYLASVPKSGPKTLVPKQIKKNKELSQWLWDLQKKWAASPQTVRFIDKHPGLLALQQFILSCDLEDVIRDEINTRTFRCNDQMVKRYVMVRKEFADPASGAPAYKRMKNKTQGQQLYNLEINGIFPRSTKYVLKHFCGIKVAGKEDISYSVEFTKKEYRYWKAGAKKMTPAQEAEDSAKANYSDEIKILREMFHER